MESKSMEERYPGCHVVTMENIKKESKSTVFTVLKSLVHWPNGGDYMFNFNIHEDIELGSHFDESLFVMRRCIFESLVANRQKDIGKLIDLLESGPGGGWKKKG